VVCTIAKLVNFLLIKINGSETRDRMIVASFCCCWCWLWVSALKINSRFHNINFQLNFKSSLIHNYNWREFILLLLFKSTMITIKNQQEKALPTKDWIKWMEPVFKHCEQFSLLSKHTNLFFFLQISLKAPTRKGRRFDGWEIFICIYKKNQKLFRVLLLKCLAMPSSW
jgi:hypothetical protein